MTIGSLELVCPPSTCYEQKRHPTGCHFCVLTSARTSMMSFYFDQAAAHVNLSSMKQIFVLLTCATLASSCSQNGNEIVAPGNNAYATIKKALSVTGTEWGLSEYDRFVHHHRDEILSTLEVESTTQIGNTELHLVLYSFVAQNRKKYDSRVMRDLNGEWVYSSSYLSSYSMDDWPGVSEAEMKRLIEKKKAWESFTPNDVWW